MAKVIIVKPNITPEENERNWESVKRVLDEIARSLTDEQIEKLNNI